MRAVIQRVARASVTWTDDNGQATCNQIGSGLLVLLGVGPDDTEAECDRLADKIAGLRIFSDQDGRFNLSLEDVSGGVLVVSQFTLYADATRGRRPSFIKAGDPERAEGLYERFAQRLRDRGLPVETGGFGEHMTVSLDNDGPVTLVLSTDDWETGIIRR
jgi:D-aminoacyl-tRNA deacylase